MATRNFIVKNGLTAGNITLNASTNTTTTSNLVVSGNASFSGPNVSLGSISNLKITGGTGGYVLSTDGTGNLSWVETTTQLAGAYVFTQSSPATTWVVNHNLGVQYVNVQVIDATGNSYTGRYNYPTITFNNAAALTITFDSAVAGYAAVTSGGGQQNVGGSNTQIQFNDANVLGGSAALTFDKTTNLVSMGGALSVTGNANVGNVGTGRVIATGNISGTQLISNVATGTAPLSVISTTKVANLNADTVDGYDTAVTDSANTIAVRNSDGNIAANYFIGNGSQLTGIITSVSNVTNGTSNLNIATSGGNVTVSVAGNANIFTVTGTGANVAGTLNVTGNANLGNIGATNGVFTNVSGNGSGLSAIAGANVTGEVAYAATANSVAGANVSGTVSSATTAGTVTTNAQPNITSVGTLSSVAVTGNATAGNVYANSGTIGASLLTGTLTTASQPNITSVGTLSSLTATGKVTAGQLQGDGGNISNIQGGNVSGAVASATSATTAGTVTTAAQPNITSVGTLSSLSVTGNVSAGNIVAPVANGNSSLTIPVAAGNVNISVNGTANVAVVTATGVNVAGTLNATGNANVGNIGATRGVFTNIAGEGGNISNIQGGNVSGAVASATSATTAGTVTTNAQPNITSVGTLSSLAVTANVTAGNVYANSGTIGAQTLKGEGGNISNIQGANVSGAVASATSATSATTAGTVTTAAQPNITSVGTLSSLAVTANVTAGNVYANSGNIGANNISTANKITAGNGLQVSSGTLTVTNGNLDVTGNINVTGNLNYSNVTDLVVGDPLIYIGANNTGDLYDLGIVASYNNGTYYHTGIARNATTDVWTFFDGVVAEPTTVIDWANATYPTVKLGNLIATGTANITGNANVGNIGAAAGVFTANVTAGNVYANSGTIGAQTLKGEGGNISNIQGANVSGAVSSATSATTAGTVTTAAQPNITSVGTLSSLAVTGNANVGNLNATSAVVASTLTSNVATGTAPLTVTSTTRVANLNVAYANVADFTNVTAPGTGTGYIVFANATTGNVAEYTSSGISSNLANNSITATTFVGALSGAATTAGTVTTAAQPNITSVGTLTGLTVGNATANAVFGNGTITLNSGLITGNGNGLSSLQAANVTGTLSNAVTNNITNVGTITSGTWNSTFTAGLNANTLANIQGGNVSGAVASATAATNASALLQNTSTATTVYPTFTTSSANGNSSAVINTGISANLGNASITATTFVGALSGAATTAGTVTTNAQPNITSVGTLTSVAVTGNATAGNVYANSGTIGASLLTGTLTTAAQPNITSVGTLSSLTVSGNVTAGNLIGPHANGNSNINVPAANGNVTVTVAGTANVAVFTATGVNVAGTLNATGNANVGNIGATNGVFTNVSGNGSALTAITGGNVTGQVGNALVAGTVYTAAQPNITSVGTLTSLAVTGNATAANFVGNLANGNSSISIPAANGNINLSAGGVTNELVVTTTGVNVNGTLNATGAGTIGGDLSVTGNAVVTGNLAINGNLTYLNVETIAVEDPIINLQTGANGAAPVANSGKDVGSALNYYDTAARVAFMGWDVSNAEFGMASVASISAEVVTFSTYGNLRVGNIIGNGQALTGLNASNISSGTLAQARLANSSLTVNGTSISLGGSATITANTTQTLTLGTYLTGTSFNGGTAVTATVDATSANTASKVVARDASGNFSAGTITATLSGAATTAGTVTTAAQPNITSVSTSFTNLTFANAQTISGNNITITTGSTSANGTLTGNWVLSASSKFQASDGNASNVLYGNGVFAAPAGGTGASISNGTSNVNIATSGGNITMGVGGTANVVTVTTSNLQVGNGSGGNISGVNVITANTFIASSHLVFSVATGISAAGTVQGNATAITKDFNIVSTVASGAGISLPTAVAGYRITVINTSANALNVYPLGNGIINSQAANAAYSQPAGSRLDFICTAAATAPGGQWYTLNATYG